VDEAEEVPGHAPGGGRARAGGAADPPGRRAVSVSSACSTVQPAARDRLPSPEATVSMMVRRLRTARRRCACGHRAVFRRPGGLGVRGRDDHPLCARCYRSAMDRARAWDLRLPEVVPANGGPAGFPSSAPPECTTPGPSPRRGWTWTRHPAGGPTTRAAT
jgi:hypothetical protein